MNLVLNDNILTQNMLRPQLSKIIYESIPVFLD